MAKQDYRSRKVERTHGRVRVEGKKGSKQGKLRHDLYKCLHDRLAEANEQAMYFEIIAICDMLITDRLEHIHNICCLMTISISLHKVLAVLLAF